jgi:transcriptional adapter 3
MSEYHRIPPLGQHYTQRWAKEDIENERQKGAASAAAGGSAASGDEAKAGILEDAQKVRPVFLVYSSWLQLP